MFSAPGPRRTEADLAKELAEIKRRALARQAEQQEQRLVDDSDDENDLEIVQDMKVVANEETGQRRALKARHTRPSEGRKRQIMLACVNVAHGHRSPPVRKFRDPFEQLKVMGQSTFGASSRDRRGNGTQQKDKLTPDDLNRILLKQITETNIKTDREKEAEWVSHGGKASEQLRQGGGDFKELETVQKVYAEKALKAITVTTEGEDESDEEWTPETNESASPSRNESDDEAQARDEDDTMDSEDEVVATIEPNENDNGEHDDEKALRGPRGPRRAMKRPRAVHDSDEDDDSQNKPILRNSPHAMDTPSQKGGMPPPCQLPKILHRPSFSSFEDPTEDETDKENNTILMYDKSEDKENKAVVRHSPGAVRRGPLSTKSFKKPRSPSPGVAISDDDGEVGERTPFKELLDDPFTSPTLRSDIPFATRLRQASSASLAPQPSPAPQQLVLGKTGASFSQFLDEAENSPKSPLSPPLTAPKLGGLSQAFEFGTESINLTKQTDNNVSSPSAAPYDSN
jgi:mediator of replication checkpoint protein 1